jgi:6-phosphogluconolactonase (cycloisomerase 2 family)
MGSKRWMMLVVAMPLLLAGCKGFWDASGSQYTLSNSGSISVTAGATSGNTSTITVTPSGSFSGTVALTCSVTTTPSNATSPVTCALSPSSVTLSNSSAQTATLTATTTSSTTTGSYAITVTGTSGSATATTTVCVAVGTSSGSCNSSASSGNFYVLDTTTSQIAGLNITSGKLTSLTGSPYATPAGPLSVAISPNGSFLYVGTGTGIYVYAIGSKGQLTLGNNSKPVSADQAISMQVSSDGGWLIDIVASAPFVHALALSSSTGLAQTNASVQFTSLPSSDVRQVAISPDRSSVLVAMGSGGTAYMPFNAGNASPFGSVTTIGLVNTAGGAQSVAFDPLQSGQTTPRLFYIGETAATSGSNSGGLRVFNFSTQKELSGSPLGTNGLAPYSILPISTGNYVYVVNRQVSGSNTGVIAGYAVNGSNGTYSVTALGSTFSVGTNPVGLAEDSTGTYVLAVDFGGSPDLQAYTFNSTNAGYLDTAVSGATGADPVQASAIAAAP